MEEFRLCLPLPVPILQYRQILGSKVKKIVCERGGGTLVLLAFLANLNFALGSWGEGTFLHYDYILQWNSSYSYFFSAVSIVKYAAPPSIVFASFKIFHALDYIWQGHHFPLFNAFAQLSPAQASIVKWTCFYQPTKIWYLHGHCWNYFEIMVLLKSPISFLARH